MIALDKDREAIQVEWAEVLKRRNCMEIYEYLYTVLLNEDYVEDPNFERNFIVRLLKMATESDLPCEPAPYGNLRVDLEHYIEVYSKDAT